MDGGLDCCQHAANHLEAGGTGCRCGPAEVHGAHPGIAPARYAPLQFRAGSAWLSEPVALLLLRTVLLRSLPAGFQVQTLNLPVACSHIFSVRPLHPAMSEPGSHLSDLSRPTVKDVSRGSSRLEPIKEPALFTYVFAI